MAIIIDLIRKKNEHHVFNSETISTLESLDPNSLFYLDENSSSISVIENKKNIRKIKVGTSKLYFWLISTFSLIRILLPNLIKGERVVLLSATPLQYILCSIFAKFINVDIVIFMHGELGYIENAVGFGQRIGRGLLLMAFKNRSKVKFVAINEYIYNCLAEREYKAKFFFVEHPLQKVECYSKGEFKKNEKLRIGLFGVQSKEKNSQKIYELVDLLDSNIMENTLIITIGVTDGSFLYDQREHVKHYCRGELGKSLIPKDEFLSEVTKLDFVLFFNNSSDAYNLIPSGVFSDCIAMGLPIISIYNKKMDYFFNKYGNVGLLCKDLNDMSNIISKLSANEIDGEKYKEMMGNVKMHFNADSYKNKLSQVIYG